MLRKPNNKRKAEKKPTRKGDGERLVSGDNILIAEVAGSTRQYVTSVKAGKRYNQKIAYLLKILPREKQVMKNRLIEAVENLVEL